MSSLETSVTLADVFTVVEAKRVPLAPELAGYLSLEIADGTDAGSGNVDPKTVFISEEGTVALVRPKRESVHGDAEASIRTLLAKLLEASGSGTPALTTAARRKPGNGLPALVEELEAALIPVNRAAGRRALARLAREVKRVLLGVGRNASVPPVVKEPPKGAAPHARPVVRKKTTQVGGSGSGLTQSVAPPGEDGKTGARPSPESKRPSAAEGAQREVPVRRSEPVIRRTPGSFEPEPATAKRANELTELASSMNAVDGAAEPGPTESTRAARESARTSEKAPPVTPRGGSLPLDVAKAPPLLSSEPRESPPLPSSPPAGDDEARLGDEPASAPVVPPPPAPPALPETPRVPAADPVFFGRDDVDSLLDSFGVSNQHGDRQMARELKAMAGLSPTPPPPDAKTLAELTKDIGRDLPKRGDADGDSIEALLALADASKPAPAVTANVGAPAPVEVKAPPPPSSPPVPLAPPPPVRAATPRPPESARGAAPPLAADPPKPRPAEPSARVARAAQAAQPTVRRPRSPDTRARAPRTGMAMMVFALLVLAGGTVAIWRFAPQVFTGKKRPTVVAAPPLASAPPAVPACKVALVISDAPPNAEILLRMGQAPTDVERMPVGTRLELVATAEGYAPRRAVLKADDVWHKGPDGKPRIEVPIQLDASKTKPGALDPWPAAEPGSQVGGSGAPGTVHVVSNVRGAEVWLLAGLGPQARIDQLRCDAEIDVLLAGPPTLRKRLHVSDKDIAATSADALGNKVLNVSAQTDAGIK